MSRVQICCFVLFFFCVAVRFGECKKREEDCNITSDIKTTRLHMYEKTANTWNSWFGKGKKNLQSKSKVTYGDFLENYYSNSPTRMIYPGTRWCGDGNNAKDENDLGKFNEADACCWAHDNCESNLEAGQSMANLRNNGRFTRSACVCDLAFYNCLKKVNGWVSNNIGRTYFNYLAPQCFKCVCSTKDCNDDDETECKDCCTKYEWKDSPSYPVFPWEKKD